MRNEDAPWLQAGGGKAQVARVIDELLLPLLRCAAMRPSR